MKKLLIITLILSGASVIASQQVVKAGERSIEITEADIKERYILYSNRPKAANISTLDEMTTVLTKRSFSSKHVYRLRKDLLVDLLLAYKDASEFNKEKIDRENKLLQISQLNGSSKNQDKNESVNKNGPMKGWTQTINISDEDISALNIKRANVGTEQDLDRAIAVVRESSFHLDYLGKLRTGIIAAVLAIEDMQQSMQERITASTKKLQEAQLDISSDQKSN